MGRNGKVGKLKSRAEIPELKFKDFFAMSGCRYDKTEPFSTNPNLQRTKGVSCQSSGKILKTPCLH